MNKYLSIVFNNLTFALFFLLIFIATYLRMYNLGSFGFSTDGFYHVLGAKFILTEGRPIFPNGLEYNRAYGFTYLISILFKYFGESEFVARLPSLFFNIAFLIVSFFLIKKTFNEKIAIIFLILNVFSPISIDLSRQCRMYTPFQFFYFLGSFFFIIGFEYKKLYLRFKNERGFNGLNIYIISLSMIFFLISYHLHKLTILFFLVLFSYLVYHVLLNIFTINCRYALNSKYFTTLAIILFLSIFIVSAKYEKFMSFYDAIHYVPDWLVHYGPANWQFYRHFITNNFPFLLFIFPLGVYVIINKYRELGVFVALSFIIPILLHSFVFTLKLDRYIFYILPFFYLICSVILALLIEYLFSFLKDNLNNANIVHKIILYNLIIFSLNIVTFPWLGNSKNISKKHQWADWKKFSELFKKSYSDDSVVISTSQNAFFYYFKKVPNYYFRVNYYKNENDAEHFINAKPITTKQEIIDITNNSKNVFFILKNYHWNNKSYINSDIQKFLSANFDEIKMKEKTGIRVLKYKAKL